MDKILDNEKLMDGFMAPLMAIFPECKNQRQCNELPDEQWLEMGLTRSLNNYQSGRDFLQSWAMSFNTTVKTSHFFESLKSKRRLDLVSEANILLSRSMPEHPDDKIHELEDLDNFELFAGDGHYHQASTHEPHIAGKKHGIGHFYALNLRTHGMTHLTGGDLRGGRKKHEHDMHALKRLKTQQLRQGAKKGRKVLYAWDCAGIDFLQWYKWKQGAGIYFLSKLKKLNRYEIYGPHDYDKKDEVNYGVLSDDFIYTATGPTTLRLVRYQCPVNGNIYEFITNEMTIRPGVIAWIYKRRWDIEKTYDTFKNKLQEVKAWAKSDNAKHMQAQFICLLHNLMVLLDSRIGHQDHVTNEKEIKRAQGRALQARAMANKKNQSISSLYQNPLKRSQLCLKFIRWLRHHLHENSLYQDALISLDTIYATF